MDGRAKRPSQRYSSLPASRTTMMLPPCQEAQSIAVDERYTDQMWIGLPVTAIAASLSASL
jgi:hypothetical protein